MEALHLKKQYLYKNARQASNASNEWEKSQSQISIQKHLLEGEVTKD